MEQVSALPSTISLKKLEFDGVFTSKNTRGTIRDKFKDSKIEVTLLKLNPNDSDDDSDAHDYSEDESQAEEDQATSQDEEEEKV